MWDALNSFLFANITALVNYSATSFFVLERSNKVAVIWEYSWNGDGWRKVWEQSTQPASYTNVVLPAVASNGVLDFPTNFFLPKFNSTPNFVVIYFKRHHLFFYGT